MKRQLDQTIDRIPPGRLHPNVQEDLPEVKRRLLKLADLIDDLGRLDEHSQEVSVDENSLRKLIREASPGSEDTVVEQLRQLPGSNLTRRGGGLKKIPWETLTERMAPAAPLAAAPAGASPGPYVPWEEIREAVQRQFPDLPDDEFEATTLNRRFQAILAVPGPAAEGEAEALPGNVWNCMVRHLGFWGACLVIAVAVAVLAVFAYVAVVLGPVGPLNPTFWAVFWMLFWDLAIPGIAIGVIYATVGIIIACVLNPFA